MYFKVFGCKYYILNTNENLGKFDSKADVEIFLRYYNLYKPYRVFNKRTLTIEESMYSADNEEIEGEMKNLKIDDSHTKHQDRGATATRSIHTIS